MKRAWPLLLVAATAGLTLYAVLLHEVYTRRGNTHPDFYVEWMGSRVALQGGNPYSEETTLAIQMGSKGQRVPPGGDQLAFVSPYYRVFLNAPLAFLPYDWATAIWQTVLQATLIVGVLLFIRSLGWRASVMDLTLVVLVTLFAYPTFGGLMLGQMAVGTLALLLVAFWALRCGRDHVAGGCLALATVKPQLIALAGPGLLLWSLARWRWRVLLSFAVVLAGLVGASFALHPTWAREFVRAVMRYPSYKSTHIGPDFLLSGCCDPVWPWLLEGVALAGMLASWWAVWRRGDQRQMDGAFALTTAMTCFLLPQTSPVDRMMLLPGVLLLMRDAPGWLARIGWVVIGIGGTWAFYACWYETHYNLNMALPPVVILLALAVWYALGNKEAR